MKVAASVALAVMLAAVTLLASELGPEGAALGTVIGETSLAASYLVALRIRARDVLPGAEGPLRALVAVGPCFAILLVDGLPAGVATAVALAAYAVLLVVLRAVPDELIDVVARR
jgi:hypothetical protein